MPRQKYFHFFIAQFLSWKWIKLIFLRASINITGSSWFTKSLFTKSCQQMSQFCWWNETISILIKVSQSLDEVIGSVGGARLAYCLVDWQKYFKTDALIRFVLIREFFHVRLGGVLAQCTQSITDLSYVYFTISTTVKQLECLLEFWEWNKQMSSVGSNEQMSRNGSLVAK